MKPGDVRDMYRVPNRKDPAKFTIIMELSDTLVKSKFLTSAKRFNKTKEFKVLHLGITNDSSPLFLSESLTAKSRYLHFLARDFARTEKYKFCWISNGNIFLKKQEGSAYLSKMKNN